MARGMARSSEGGEPTTSRDKAVSFIVSLGHERALAKGVVESLERSGLRDMMLLSTVRSLAGRWEVGADAGLEDLIAAVRQEQAAAAGVKRVQFLCVPPSAWHSGEGDVPDESPEALRAMRSRAFCVEALEGMSVADVATHGTGPGAATMREYLECACSGVMACSTCHVVVESGWFGEGAGKVPPPEEAELDMLDLAYNPMDTSRLGCQLILRGDLDGLVLRLVKRSNNLMDYIPFQDKR